MTTALALFLSLLAAITPLGSFGITASFLYGVGVIGALAIGNGIQLALLLFLLSIYWRIAPELLRSLPTLPFLIPLVASELLVLPTRKTRGAFAWLSRGQIDRISQLLIVVTGVASTAALILWANWTDHFGVAGEMAQGLSHIPYGLLVGMVIPMFALLNALAEEAVYRGVMQDTLARTIRSPAIVIILQAAAFAAVHFASGFPNGVVGYAMVFVYAIVLGYLRFRTRGLLAPYLAHVLADLTIGYFLVWRFV